MRRNGFGYRDRTDTANLIDKLSRGVVAHAVLVTMVSYIHTLDSGDIASCIRLLLWEYFIYHL